MKKHLLRNVLATIAALFITLFAPLQVAQAQETARGFGTFKQTDAYLNLPIGATYNTTKRAVCDESGNIVKGEAKVRPHGLVLYDLKLLGTQVTSDNCTDLSAISGVEGSGSITFDEVENVLTLEDVTLRQDNNLGDIVNSLLDDLRIVIKGKVNMVCTSSCSPVYVCGNLTIEGGGTLNITGEEDACIYMDSGGTLTIDGCTLNVESESIGLLAGMDDKPETLRIRNGATVTVIKGGIQGFAMLDLQDGCVITAPEGAVWNAEKASICDTQGKEIWSEKVVLGVQKYGVQVAGVRLTSANYDRIEEIPGVTGSVSYDPATRTLTMEDAEIASSEPYSYALMLEDSVDTAHYRLLLKGDNTLKTTHQNVLTVMCCDKTNVTIECDDYGTLVIDNEGAAPDKGGAIWITGDTDMELTLTIRNCYVWDATGFGYAGSSFTNSITRLVVDSASVETTRIEGFNSITLKRAEITHPDGVFLTDEGQLWRNGAVYLGPVTIMPVKSKPSEPTGVDAVSTDTINRLPIYNLQGLHLGNDLKRLPAGLYIVGGKKVMKR